MPYKSPFEPARGAVLGALGDVTVILHYGDPAGEAAAMRREAALVDLSWRGVIEMTGRDRVRFLHGMCTNDIKKLQPGQGCMAAIVNRQGKMVAEMIALATENALLLEMDRSNLQPAIDHLNRFLVADDVKMHRRAGGIVARGGAAMQRTTPGSRPSTRLPPAWRGARSRRRGRIVPTIEIAINRPVVMPARSCGTGAGTHSAFTQSTRRRDVYSILYIIGAIVVIIVVLRLLGLY